MSALETGQTAPDFTLATDGGGSLTLSSLQGKNVVLYFYPKDDTPGCTKEAIGFTEALSDFEAENTVIVGVSPDTAAKHDKFKAKHDLGITLVSDPEQVAANGFGVWVEKSMYGKTYMGVERSTFLIDPEGKIAEIWRKVKVPGHVDAVLERVKSA